MVASITLEFKMAKDTRIQIEADILLHKQKKAVEAAATELYNLMKSGQRNDLIGKIWPNLNEVIGIPILHLEPMNRLGGDQGRTGSTVLGGRFFPTKNGEEMLPSRPMIVKVSPEPGSLGASESRKWLIDECEAAENLQYQFDNPARFACPLHKYCSGERSPVVLWAPMVSTMERYPSMNFKQRRTAAKVDQLFNLLSCESPYFYKNISERKERLCSVIEGLKHLKEAHCAKGTTKREDVNLVDHYECELRNFNKKYAWTRPWKRLWKQKSRVRDFYDNWPNPRIIFRKLARVSYLHAPDFRKCLHVNWLCTCNSMP